MIGSLTVLPALLSKLGDRVEKGRIPFLQPAPPRRAARTASGRRSSTPALRHPVVSAIAADRRAARRWRCRCCSCTPRSPASTRCRRASPTVEHDRPDPGRVPGRRRPGARRDQGRRRLARDAARRSPSCSAQALASGQMHGPDRRSTSTPAHTVARVAIPLAGNGTDATSNARAADAPQRASCRRRRHGPGRDLRGHRRHGGLGRRERAAQALGAARVRLRAHVRVPAAAGLVPLDRDRGQGDRAEPAVGRRRLRRARRRLPVRLGREPPRLPARTAASRPGCRSSCS